MHHLHYLHSRDDNLLKSTPALMAIENHDDLSFRKTGNHCEAAVSIYKSSTSSFTAPVAARVSEEVVRGVKHWLTRQGPQGCIVQLVAKEFLEDGPCAALTQGP